MANYWVIGGTSGIGAATVKELSIAGNGVYTTGEANCDVSDPYAVSEQYQEVIDYFGGQYKLDAVVFSAGINRLCRADDFTYGQLATANDVIQVNLMGFINVMGALAYGVRAKECPLRVVAVSSDAAERPMRTSAAYCASKAGLNMAVKCFARELGPFGWRVNAVAPGMTAPTGMSEYIDRTVPELRGWTLEQAMHYERSQEVVPGRIHPSEVAKVIADTLSGPTHLNGSIITINGGR